MFKHKNICKFNTYIAKLAFQNAQLLVVAMLGACSVAKFQAVNQDQSLTFTPPNIVISNKYFVKSSPTFSGNCSAPGADIKLNIENQNLEFFTQCPFTQTWSIDAELGSLPDGEYTVKAEASIVGREAASALITVVKDTTGPIFGSSITHSQWNASVTSSPLIALVSATDLYAGVGKYEIALGTSTSTQDTSDWTEINDPASFSGFTGLNLAEGNHYYVQLRATDKVGNTSQTLVSSGWEQVFDISASPNMAAWFKAETLLSDNPNLVTGDEITTWNDSSPSQFIATAYVNPNAPAGPTYHKPLYTNSVPAFNGLPGVRFTKQDKSCLEVNVGNPLSVLNNKTGASVFAVLAPLARPNGEPDNILTISRQADLKVRFALITGSHTPSRFHLIARRPDDNANPTPPLESVGLQGILPNRSAFLVSGIIDYANAIGSIFNYDSTSPLAATRSLGFGAGGTDATDSMYFTLGGNGGCGREHDNQYFDGYIAELIFFNVGINLTLRAKIEQYLAAKYNIQ